jgi:mono/diheme cytochrome c family protein
VGALERVGRLPHGVVPFRSKPPEISTARGRVLYDIHCAVCHGLTGSGKTVLGLRGFKSPSLLKSLSDNEVVNAILQGKGKMYSFQDRLEENEARAIAAYLKALRFSQAARFLDLPPEDRAELEKR